MEALPDSQRLSDRPSPSGGLFPHCSGEKAAGRRRGAGFRSGAGGDVAGKSAWRRRRAGRGVFEDRPDGAATGVDGGMARGSSSGPLGSKGAAAARARAADRRRPQALRRRRARPLETSDCDRLHAGKGLDLNGRLAERGRPPACRRRAERHVPQEEAAEQARRGGTGRGVRRAGGPAQGRASGRKRKRPVGGRRFDGRRGGGRAGFTGRRRQRSDCVPGGETARHRAGCAGAPGVPVHARRGRRRRGVPGRASAGNPERDAGENGDGGFDEHALPTP